MNPDIADNVAKLCYEHFNNLPKTGKPRLKQEWTLLAAIVMSSGDFKQRLKVISLSTGTKCLGYNQLTENGDVVFDSHAEVLARRAFMRFIYHQMSIVLAKKHSDVLFWDEVKSKFDIKPVIKFHLFISHVPCGDAAIFPKPATVKRSLSFENQNESSIDESEDSSQEKMKKKLKTDSSEINAVSKKTDVSALNTISSDDIYRTGAKCVESGIQDPKKKGVDFHVIGALRTKPGRGDPTWSMSCSDKIALWNVCGLQGALLSLLLATPVYISSLIFGKCPLDKKAVERAVISRISTITNIQPAFKINIPEILQSSLIFEFSKDNLIKENKNASPCSSSIIWCDIPNFLNVSVNGRKQGITKKNLSKPSSRVEVCKCVLFEKFWDIIEKLPSDFVKPLLSVHKEATYMDYKLKAEQYQSTKLAVLKIFDGWKKKPDRLQRFTCSNVKNL